jgi:hypothetical protein
VYHRFCQDKWPKIIPSIQIHSRILLGKGDPRVYRFDRALIGTVKGPLHAAQG